MNEHCNYPLSNLLKNCKNTEYSHKYSQRGDNPRIERSAKISPEINKSLAHTSAEKSAFQTHGSSLFGLESRLFSRKGKFSVSMVFSIRIRPPLSANMYGYSVYSKHHYKQVDGFMFFIMP
jgi:hypothetical protein